MYLCNPYPNQDHLWYDSVTVANNIELYTWNLSRAYILRGLTTHKKVCEVMDVWFSLIVVINSQCICISKHQVVHLKYI